MKVFPVILAGGSGKRFWPLSRKNNPKQFLKLFSDRTLFEETLSRLPEDRIEKIIVVTTENLARHLEDRYKNLVILKEPAGRNTAPAICFALAYVKKEFGEGVLSVLPSDHFIEDIDLFKSYFNSAVEASKEDAIVTFGVIPSYPETGYGYIKYDIKNFKKYKDHQGHAALKFVEKPDLATAKQYLAEGGYLWNSGMFFFNTEFLWQEYKKFLPDIFHFFDDFTKKPSGFENRDEFKKGFQSLNSISIDYGIAEKSKHITVFPVNFNWSDVGSYRSLLKFKKNYNFYSGKDIFSYQSKDCVVINKTEKKVVISEIKDTVVVVMDDVIFVTDVKKAQSVKNLVEILEKKQDFKELL